MSKWQSPWCFHSLCFAFYFVCFCCCCCSLFLFALLRISIIIENGSNKTKIKPNPLKMNQHALKWSDTILFKFQTYCDKKKIVYYYLFGLFSVDAVNNLESNGHVLNGNTENGVTTLNNVTPINLTKTDQDMVRLIGQYLKIVGLGYVLEQSINVYIS